MTAKGRQVIALDHVQLVLISFAHGVTGLNVIDANGSYLQALSIPPGEGPDPAICLWIHDPFGARIAVNL
jgi:hypothetical protein